MNQIFFLAASIIAILLFVAAGLVWLFGCHGLDRIKHPEEWKTTGSSGERIVYNTLIAKFNIPENQILRNVYIPTKTGKTSEIDLLVISKKGLFVFECKNYGGNIYGDAKRQNWIQYIGNQKHYFYSPLLQNKNHAKYLREFLAKDNLKVPIIPVIGTITRGDWKIRNLAPTDYVLGINCHLKDIYESLPDSKEIAKHFKALIVKLTPLSRPDEETRQRHIEQIRK